MTPVHGFDPRLWGAKCDECPLGPNGFLREPGKPWAPVPPEIHGASVIAVAENPADEETKYGRPLCGRSGVDAWNPALEALGKTRADVDLTNVIACQCPGVAGGAFKRMEKALADENKRRKDLNLAPAPSPVECCAPLLHAVLSRYLNVIVLGGTAAKAILKTDQGIFGIRGGPRELPTTDPEVKRKVLPTFHPSFVLRATQWTEAFQSDLAKAFRWFENKRNWSDPEVIIRPTLQEIWNFLRDPSPYGFETYDYETNSKEALTAQVRCIGIGKMIEPKRITCEACHSRGTKVYDWNPLQGWVPTMQPGTRCERCGGRGFRMVDASAIVIPVLSVDGNATFYTPEEMEWIRGALRYWLTDPTRTKVGHNAGSYDRIVSEQWLQVTPYPLIDTLFPSRMRAPDLPKNLGVVGGILTDVHVWKNDAEGNKIAYGAQSDWQLHYYCLHHGTPVVLADGSTRSIHEIVERREQVDVLAWGPDGRVGAYPVRGWHRQLVEGQAWTRIRTDADHPNERGLITTPDHEIATGRGWVHAEQVHVGDTLFLPEMAPTREQEQAVLGTLLGDTILVVSPVQRKQKLAAKTAALSGSHRADAGLAQYKIEALGALGLRGARKAAREVPGPRGQTVRRAEAIVLSSPMRRAFAAYLPLFYDESGRRRLFLDTVKRAGPVGWAWWFADDGCRQKSKWKDSLCLSVQRYPREDIEKVKEWFEENFGRTYLGADNVLRLHPDAARAFGNAIAPYLPECVRYKLPVYDGHDWPAFVGFSSTPSGQPVAAKVTEVSDYTPNASSPPLKVRAKTRYCLTVEGAGCFFTSFGLVSNCALDCVVNARIFPPLMEAVTRVGGNRPLPEHLKPKSWPAWRAWTLLDVDHKTQEMCVGLHYIGAYVDHAAREKHEKKLAEEAAKYRQMAVSYAESLGVHGRFISRKRGYARFNPGSNDQLATVLFEKWGIVPDTFTETNAPSVADEVKRKILTEDLADERPDPATGKPAGPRWAFLDAVRRYNRAVKARGTFVLPTRLRSQDPEHGLTWEDNRIRSSWAAHTTSVARLSSSGNNQQNVPSKYRDIYACASGHGQVGGDVDQFHLRIIANRWGIGRLLEAFERGIDPHSALAYDFFGDKFKHASGWGPNGFSLLTKDKPKKDTDADKMRQVAKVIRYRGAYWDTPEGIRQSVIKTEDSDGNLPFAHYTDRQVRALSKIWMRAEPEWERAWQWCLDRYRQNGGWLESAILGRRSGTLENGKKEAVVNYDILPVETDIMRLIECEVLAAFPFFAEGPGTGMINQCHDSLNIERVGHVWEEPEGRTEQGPDVYWRFLGKGRILCWERKLEWDRRKLEECMNVTIPGWPVKITSEAKVGRNWKEA